MDEAGAEREAQRFWQYEKALSTHALDQQEYGNVDKIYNVLTMDDIRAAFPNVDIDAVFAQSGLAPADKVVVSDVGLMRAYAELFTEEMCIRDRPRRITSGTRSIVAQSL